MSAIDYIKDWRILIVVVLVAVLAVLDAVHGLSFGMEFVGGAQIPVTLAHSVNPLEMDQIVSILNQRVTKFGLSQVTVQPVGNSGIYVDIPTTTGSEINSTVSIIEQQGVFQGIVNGKEALNGSGILGGASGITSSYTAAGDNVTWIVNFYVTQQAQQKFIKTVFGQADKPIYMFLDRPANTILLFNESLISSNPTAAQEEIAQMQDSLQFGSQTVPLELLNAKASNWDSLYSFFATNRGKFNSVLLQRGTPSYITDNLTSLNYTLNFQTAANMTPQFITGNLTNPVILDSWPAVGLLSAPTLSPSLTTGAVSGNEGYEINGVVTNSTTQGAIGEAQNRSKQIVTILSGGALPVQVIVGQPITTPPTLGKHFEVISAEALVLAIIAVGITIVVRYKKLFLIAPIMLTTLAELFIIGSIMGLAATINLAAVAGMIAVVGTGVDAQIIITDETLAGRRDTNLKVRIGHAFYIVVRNAILLTLAMLPLFFSSLTSEIWFAGATMIGALLGAAITRPAYGALVSRHYAEKV